MTMGDVDRRRASLEALHAVGDAGLCRVLQRHVEHRADVQSDRSRDDPKLIH
jgi:hypothetical protein